MAPPEPLVAVGSLRLELTSTSFFAGDTLTGTVYLTLHEPVKNATLKVELNGSQRLHWWHVVRGSMTPVKNEQVDNHLHTVTHLGELNGAMPEGEHLLPFSFQLPRDLIANASIEDIVRKQVDDYRSVRVEVDYDVTARLEVAGSSNGDLTDCKPFAIAPAAVRVPTGSPLRAEVTEKVKSLGFGKGGPCTVRFASDKNVAVLPSSTISVDVEIRPLVKRKPHEIKIILYEDVYVDRGSHIKNGSRHVPRAVCSQVYKTKQLEEVDSEPSPLLRGTLQLTISDPDEQWYGAVAPSLSSRFLQIRHRLCVECEFLMGPTVKASAAITLIDPTPKANKSFPRDNRARSQTHLGAPMATGILSLDPVKVVSGHRRVRSCGVAQEFY